MWGQKAAEAGLSSSENPYQNPQSRMAWRAGYRCHVAEEERLRELALN